MKVLGVDPSSRAIGLAMLEGEDLLWSRTITLRGKVGERLMLVGPTITAALALDRPDVVVQEAPGPWTRGKAGSTTRTVETLAKVRGIIFAAAVALGVECHEIAVNRARHLVLGKGNPKKDVVMASVKLLGYDVPDDDAADALVAALAWQQEQRLEAMIAESKT